MIYSIERRGVCALCQSWAHVFACFTFRRICEWFEWVYCSTGCMRRRTCSARWTLRLLAGSVLISSCPSANFDERVWMYHQHVAIRHLEDRVNRAVKLCRADDSIPDLDCLVVCGGVAANQQVRSRLQAVAEKNEIRSVFPPGEASPHPFITCNNRLLTRSPCGAWTAC